MGKVLIARSALSASAADVLAARNSVLAVIEQAGHEVVLASTQAQLRELIPRVDALYLNSPLRADAELLSAAGELRVIAAGGAGYDHIDVAAAQRLGVRIVTAGAAGSLSVAEHVLTVMGALSKDLLRSHRAVQEGDFDFRWGGRRRELAGKQVAIAGYGSIGAAVARLCRAVGMTPVAVRYSPSTRAGEDGVATHALADALATSHFVTVHLPLSDSTHHFIGDDQFRAMRPDAFLINTSRGAIIDETALVRALTSGRIAGAALDVFEEEPVRSDNPLLALDNVILTPHNAGITVEALKRMGEQVGRLIVEAMAEAAAGTERLPP